MPPNQSPLASILQWFQGGRTPQNNAPGTGQFGPYSGWNPYGSPPGPFVGGPPATPGFGGMGSRNPGLFGIGDFLNNLRNIDITKVIEGINTFRNFMANAQKVATTLQQLGITISNVQKIMSQIDVSGLLNLLNSDNESSSEETNEGASTSPIERPKANRPHRKRKIKKSHHRRKTAMRKKYDHGKKKRITPKKSVPLFKIPE